MINSTEIQTQRRNRNKRLCDIIHCCTLIRCTCPSRRAVQHNIPSSSTQNYRSRLTVSLEQLALRFKSETNYRPAVMCPSVWVVTSGWCSCGGSAHSFYCVNGDSLCLFWLPTESFLRNKLSLRQFKNFSQFLKPR